jgi:hypothetical protein
MLGIARAAFLAATLVIAGSTAHAQDGPQPRLRTTPLVAETVTGRHRFTVEMAISPTETARGLMFRTAMPQDEGMLFDFGRDEIVTMWMRNTILPLDMVFIDREGRVASIAERTTPFSEAVISSRVPARAVLEVNAGTVRRIGLRVGDRVRNVIFGNGP